MFSMQGMFSLSGAFVETAIWHYLYVLRDIAHVTRAVTDVLPCRTDACGKGTCERSPCQRYFVFVVDMANVSVVCVLSL